MPKRKRLGIDTEAGSKVPADRPAIPAEIRERVVIEPGQPLPPEIVSLVAERVEGPLPSPRVMKLYAEIIPDLPDRIVSAWEKESSHRRELQRKSSDLDQHYVEESLRLSRLGVHYAFVISLGGHCRRHPCRGVGGRHWRLDHARRLGRPGVRVHSRHESAPAGRKAEGPGGAASRAGLAGEFPPQVISPGRRRSEQRKCRYLNPCGSACPRP